MEDVYASIEATKKIISKQVQDNKTYICERMFSEFSSVYAFTNENIDGYMSQFDFQSKSSALSVLASGDHSFNLVYNGIYDIDTFDTNKLSEFFVLGLKRAAILTHDHPGFLALMFTIMNSETSLEELTSLVNDLIPFMERRHAYYWQEVIAFNYSLQKNNPFPLNLFEMLLVNTLPPSLNTLKNTYLIDEEHYDKLRATLGKANISFTPANALTLQESFKREYDFLLLSNILDYFHKAFGWGFDYKCLQGYMAQMKTLLKSDGTLAAHYIIGYIRSGDIKSKLILGSRIEQSDLTSEGILVFPDIYYNQVSSINKDGLLLERKK